MAYYSIQEGEWDHFQHNANRSDIHADMGLEQTEVEPACGRPKAERDEDEENNKGWLAGRRAASQIEASPVAPVLRADWARDSVWLVQESRTRLKSRAVLVGHKW